MADHYEVIKTFINETGQEKGSVSGAMAMQALDLLVSSALEQAAKAVCELCRDNSPLDASGFHQVPVADGAKWSRSEPCQASAIYALAALPGEQGSVPYELFCPQCNTQHIDEGEWATKPHRKHLCAACHHEWRPYPVATVGVVLPPDPRDAALALALPRLTAMANEIKRQGCGRDERRLEWVLEARDAVAALLPSEKGEQ